jgi:hypothetical protein
VEISFGPRAALWNKIIRCFERTPTGWGLCLKAFRKLMAKQSKHVNLLKKYASLFRNSRILTHLGMDKSCYCSVPKYLMFSTEVTWSPIHPWSCLEVPLHLLDSTPAVRVISHNQVTEHPVDNGMPRNQTGWVDVGKDGAVENPRKPRERSLRGWYEETNDKKTLVLNDPLWKVQSLQMQ